MFEALTAAKDLAAAWIKDHADSFPPIVLNISDGENTTDWPEPAADAIRAISVEDGAALVFNLHLSKSPSAPVLFPDNEGSLPDTFAQQAFRMTSVMPGKLRDAAVREGLNIAEGARGFVFNADIAAVVKFLDIGTQLEPQER